MNQKRKAENENVDSGPPAKIQKCSPTSDKASNLNSQNSAVQLPTSNVIYTNTENSNSSESRRIIDILYRHKSVSAELLKLLFNVVLRMENETDKHNLNMEQIFHKSTFASKIPKLLKEESERHNQEFQKLLDIFIKFGDEMKKEYAANKSDEEKIYGSTTYFNKNIYGEYNESFMLDLLSIPSGLKAQSINATTQSSGLFGSVFSNPTMTTQSNSLFGNVFPNPTMTTQSNSLFGNVFPNPTMTTSTMPIDSNKS